MVASPCVFMAWLSRATLNGMIEIIGGDIYVLLILPRLFSQRCDAKRGCLQELRVS